MAKNKKQKITDTVKKMAKKSKSKTDKDALKSLLLKDMRDKKEQERLERVELNKNIEPITVFMNDRIPLCKQLTDKLTEEGISFIEKDIDKEKQEWEDLTLITNQAQLPTVIINGEYLVANRDWKQVEQVVQIAQRIGKKGVILPPTDVRTIEGFKNMASGFQQSFTNLNTQMRQLSHQLNTVTQFIDKLKEEIESEDE